MKISSTIFYLFQKTSLCIFVLILTQSKAYAEQVLIPKQIPIPKEYFGLHIHKASSTQWPDTNFGSWRLLDAGVSWMNIQPEANNWDFSSLDNYAHLAKNKHIDLLMPLAYPATWASSKPEEKGPYGLGSAAPPKNMDIWQTFITKLAQRYNNNKAWGTIRNYEIWNEANEPGFFIGTQDELLKLAETAYTAIKNVNPDNKLLSPSAVGGYGAFDWLDAYLAKGGGNYADIMAYHFYVPTETPEAMVTKINQVKAVLKKHKQSDKPLWNTETGWWIQYTDGTPATNNSVDKTWLNLSPSEGAAFVSRALILGWAAGLDRFYWYAWDSQNMGLIEPTTHTLKPAGLAFKTTEAWLTGNTLSECKEDNNGLWVCDLINSDGTLSKILWTTTKEISYEIPKDWQNSPVNLSHLDGKNELIINNNFVVTDTPVLLTHKI
jgi:hypothetical protein